MKLDEKKLENIKTILQANKFKWINTGRVSDDWKQLIYEHESSGLQIAIMDQNEISFRLEKKLAAIDGITQRENCPKGPSLNISKSHFENNKGYCYFAESENNLADFINLYCENHVDSKTTYHQLSAELESLVTASIKDDDEARNKRLESSDRMPKKTIVTTSVFSRNPDVIAHVLIRADGVCERCHQEAPFIRRSNSTPYLEVHHKKTLADGGEDTVENALALCPNCHREAHYGSA